MNEPATLLIRADAGGNLGTGHVMRMVALAQAWQDRGGHTQILACSCPEGLITRVQSEGIGFQQWHDVKMGSLADAERTNAEALRTKASWIVLDGYHFDENYQHAVKGSGARVLAVDDWGHSNHWDVDLLLNQNFHAPEQFRGKPVGLPATRILAGPKYALLRREFRQPPARLERGNNPPRLLVTFGGVDPGNATGRILGILAKLGLDCEVTALVGAGNPNRLVVEEICQGIPGARVLHAVADMAALYASQDAVISAAGSSCYEWLRYQLPALVYAIADNQLPLFPHLQALGGVEASGWLHESNDDQILEALKRLHARAMEPAKVECPIDGQGAERVVANMKSS